jgi:hypothetical protein
VACGGLVSADTPGGKPELRTLVDPSLHDLVDELSPTTASTLSFERVRRDYNGVRLHQGIGYVTPNDEHEGRGDPIRQARIEGLRRAHGQRVTYHRRAITDHPEETP